MLDEKVAPRANRDCSFWAPPRQWGEFVTLFATLDRKGKFYRRRDDTAGALRPVLDEFVPTLSEKTAGDYRPGPQGIPAAPICRRLSEKPCWRITPRQAYSSTAAAKFCTSTDTPANFWNRLRFVLVNDAYERIMGVTNEQVNGKNLL
jgi:hypothetical protein